MPESFRLPLWPALNIDLELSESREILTYAKGPETQVGRPCRGLAIESVERKRRKPDVIPKEVARSIGNAEVIHGLDPEAGDSEFCV